MKDDYTEIDDGRNYTGFREAINIIAGCITTSGEELIPLSLCSGRIAAADITALVSHPLDDVSLKDGYAVKSSDIACAAKGSPVLLDITGSSFAGVEFTGSVNCGSAVKICSGGKIPAGSDAVVSAEFCEETGPGKVLVRADAGPGRNIMSAGSEVAAGAVIVKKGEKLLPGKMGLAAAAGISSVKVFRRPRTVIISIGDEIVTPGKTLSSGELYASNMITMEGWLAAFGIPCVTSVVKDSAPEIMKEVQMHLPNADVILTTGGAWSSERDMIIGVMDKLSWEKKFHYLRMGPGKGTAFGLLEGTPVFCLPGGPSSNQAAFLQLALPAILRMGGEKLHPLQTIHARLSDGVKGRSNEWTEFKDAVVTRDDAGNLSVSIYRNKSRLQGIAFADAIICIPEGRDALQEGEIVPVQLLAPRPNIL